MYVFSAYANGSYYWVWCAQYVLHNLKEDAKFELVVNLKNASYFMD